jgi:AhpC/TSA antioxidant enzyme
MGSIWLNRPAQQSLAARPWVGDAAPVDAALLSPQRWRLVAFLRHVGCPFAEHTVVKLRAWAQAHPDVAVFIVSHGDTEPTRSWLATIGGTGRTQLVTDPQRRLYGRWGVGYSGLWHFAGPRSLLGVLSLWPQGIRNRSASGTRWQRAATFLLDGGHVAWAHVPASAQELVLPPASVLSQDGAACASEKQQGDGDDEQGLEASR